MWTELLTNKKMIDSMFPKGMELGLPEISNISISSANVRVSMNLRDIPEECPKKWHAEPFNAIHLVLEFSGIIEFETSGAALSWLETFDIKNDKKTISANIGNESFVLKVKSQFFTVRNVTPYEDTRW